jgi:hypothetical protein
MVKEKMDKRDLFGCSHIYGVALNGSALMVYALSVLINLSAFTAML